MSVQQLITDNLDIWIAAHKTRSSAGRGSSNKLDLAGIRKLRELILELAVRGRLVPQDPNDEPASELLKKIATEKAKLIKEGKTKKVKTSPKLNENEIPFDLPMGWDVAHLQDVCIYIQRGKGPVYADSGRVRVVSQKCIQWRGFDIEQARCVDDKSLSAYQDERYLRNNDLLWNSTGTGTVGRIAALTGIESKILVADSHVTVIRPVEVNSRFLCTFISAPGIQHRIEPGSENALVSGTTNQVELNTSSVMSVVIPIPPLAEQHRIVTKVDELMAFCDQLEQTQSDNIAAHAQLIEALLTTIVASADRQDLQNNWRRIAAHFDTLFTTESSIDQLKQTILQLATTGRLLSANAATGKLSDFLTFGPKNGFSPIESFTETPYKVLKLGATSFGFLDLSQTKFVDVTFPNDSHLWLKSGDILIQRGNSSVFVGSNVLIREDLPNVIYPDLMMKLRVSEKVLPEYVSLWLSAPASREYMWQRMTGTSGTMPKISKGIVEGVPIVVPSLEVQHQIVTKVDNLISLCDTLKSSLQNAQTTQLALANALVEQAVG